MKCAMQLEAGFQLSEGVNMTRRVNVMNVETEETDEIQDTRARANRCWGCGEIGHFYKDCPNPDKKKYRDKIKEQATLELNWSMGGKKVFGSEPIDGVLAKLF